jgi:uncharacterized membrane protein YbhN (UPF0104 family)
MPPEGDMRTIASLTLRMTVGLAVGALLLFLTLRNVNIDDVRETLRLIDGRWVIVAIASYAIALFVRTIRWWIILRSAANIKVGQVGLALLQGYAVNALLPARLGEIFRADYCGRRYQISRSTVFGTIMIERFTDAVVVLCALLVGLAFVGLDSATSSTLYSLLLTGAAAVGAFGALLFIVGTRFGHGLVANYPRIGIRLSLLRDSMQLLRTRRMAGVLLISLAVWTFDGGAIWAVLRACGVELGFYATCLAIGIVSLSTLLPSPPGFVGTMQFAFALAVAVAGYSRAQGIAAATANQVFLLGSLIVVGLTVSAGSWSYTISRKTREIFQRA